MPFCGTQVLLVRFNLKTYRYWSHENVQSHDIVNTSSNNPIVLVDDDVSSYYLLYVISSNTYPCTSHSGSAYHYNSHSCPR